MIGRRIAAAGGIALLAVIVGWIMYAAPRWYGSPAASAVAAPPPTAPPPPGRKIKAHLFYVSDDGTRLKSVEREIAYGEGTTEQAREIVAAQIGPVTDPLVSAIPPGTTLRALFITDKGQAYVDLSGAFSTAHPGGATDELLTVYTIVDAITTNLPAVTSVQLLVDGKQVDTLAGHVDLLRPLAKNTDWVE